MRRDRSRAQREPTLWKRQRGILYMVEDKDENQSRETRESGRWRERRGDKGGDRKRGIGRKTERKREDKEDRVEES
jgi:hypothetical protein